MKKTDSLSRMNAVAAKKLVIELRGEMDTSLTVEAGLLNSGDSDTVLHATTVLKAGWSDEVVEAVKALADAVEEHLLQVHFMEDGRDRRQKGGDQLPPSIISELGDTTDPIHQL